MFGTLERNDRASVPGIASPEFDSEHKEVPDQGVWLLCGICGARITRKSVACNVEGKHEHTHVNPEGIPYMLACFAEAPGCLPIGDTTAYFSWFRGYCWQVLICAQCGLHLGWLFTSTGDKFAGLIATRLVEETLQ